jgi:hypothetical protein
VTPLALILTALALAQSPGAPAPAPDAPFRLAVESWVARHRRPGVSFVHVLGPRATGAIEAMGSGRYRVRELGAAVLMGLPERERDRALAWGLAAHPDPEVRGRCRAMWAAGHPPVCWHCHSPPGVGCGTCPNWRKPGAAECPTCGISWTCLACPPP